MSTRYTRQNLSDRLAEIGKELGHIPKPEDLKGKGRPRYATFLKYFDDSWDLALEYAGYTKEHIAELEKQNPPVEPAPEQNPEPTPVGATPEQNPEQNPEPTPTNPPPVKPPRKFFDPYHPDNIQLINLYQRSVVLSGEDGTTKELPYAGTATVTFKPVGRARAEVLLKFITCKTRITLSEEPAELFILRPDGTKEPFPERKAGVYYLVSRKAAHSARDLGRTTLDLIYPGLIANSYGSTKVIKRLEMIASQNLWRVKP